MVVVIWVMAVIFGVVVMVLSSLILKRGEWDEIVGVVMMANVA